MPPFSPTFFNKQCVLHQLWDSSHRTEGSGLARLALPGPVLGLKWQLFCLRLMGQTETCAEAGGVCRVARYASRSDGLVALESTCCENVSWAAWGLQRELWSRARCPVSHGRGLL